MKIRSLAVFVLFSSCFLVPTRVHAVPSFSRQTGQNCAACHVGSFGAQLNSFGREFKLGGYTAADVKSYWNNLSAMVFGGYEHTAKDLPPDSTDHEVNDNWTVDQVSLFYCGALASHVGLFAQATYDGVADAYSWDNVDLRYANTTQWAGKELIYGVTVNNNPTVQDLWQTAPAWMFPYAASGIAPTPDAAPYITSLGQTVAGAGVYGMWNGLLYAEISGYGTLGDRLQQNLGETDVSTSDHLDGLAPYWRAALQHTFGRHYASLGTFGIYAKRYPGNDRTSGTDAFLDNAVDATYQYSFGNHNVSVYGSALHEHQDLDATAVLGGSSNQGDNLRSYNANASYYYRNTYGITVGHFITQGSADELLFPDAANHRPDSEGSTIQMDVTPFSTEKSFGYPYFNARFFVQYTIYDKFNGLRQNYDGTGRDASDNNTLFMGTWLTF